jgi:hypothetical protein
LRYVLPFPGHAGGRYEDIFLDIAVFFCGSDKNAFQEYAGIGDENTAAIDIKKIDDDLAILYEDIAQVFWALDCQYILQVVFIVMVEVSFHVQSWFRLSFCH